MIIRKYNKLLIMVMTLAMIFSVGCASSENQSDVTNEPPPVQGDEIEATDYGDASNWASLPDKNAESTAVDVFCLYPTSYDGGEGNLSSIGNEVMREGADAFIENKASAFDTAGNIYAPYYRQLDANWFLTLPENEQAQYLKGAPLTDVAAAFDYYIQNYNEGKPFVLVGHSQGSSMTKALLETYLKDNPDVMGRMVAAYVLGYYVTEDDLKANPHWKFAEDSDDTGVIISYNTVSPDTKLDKLTVWREGAISINPISWTRTDKLASAEDSLGSYVKVDDEYQRVEDLADAKVDTKNGVVICDSLTEEQQNQYAMPKKTEVIFSNGSYHGNDIGFYYFNLRENAEKRVAAFLSENPKFNKSGDSSE